MKKVLILHGWGGSSYPHWQTQTASKLLDNGYDVLFPTLPNKDNPTLKSWLLFLDKQMKVFDPDIVVCHSLANILWFHYTNNYKIKQLKKLMLVSPVSNDCKIDELKTFFPYPIVTNLKADEIIMVGSSNDPYMTKVEIMKLQTELNIGLKILDNAGHINSDSGYGKLDCAFDWIERKI